MKGETETPIHRRDRESCQQNSRLADWLVLSPRAEEGRTQLTFQSSYMYCVLDGKSRGSLVLYRILS